MNRSIWRVMTDSDTYRSLANPSIHPREFLELNELFREGTVIGEAWDPPEFYLYEDQDEEIKPISHFPGFSGLFIINQEALDILYPLIETTIIEVLPLPSSIEGLSVLNIEMVDCIDHSRSQFKRFSSGRIMRVERYAFVEQKLACKHIFRLREESFAKVFADDVFKDVVEKNELRGLLFFGLNQI